MIRMTCAAALLTSALLAWAGPAMAQDEPPAVTTLVLHPAAAPVPPLKYPDPARSQHPGARQRGRLLSPGHRDAGPAAIPGRGTEGRPGWPHR